MALLGELLDLLVPLTELLMYVHIVRRVWVNASLDFAAKVGYRTDVDNKVGSWRISGGAVGSDVSMRAEARIGLMKEGTKVDKAEVTIEGERML